MSNGYVLSASTSSFASMDFKNKRDEIYTLCSHPTPRLMQAKHVPGLHGNVGMNLSIFLLTLSP
jgi:hypothetical protein